jgi:glycosyltransferase involved in cell wall biosynthesis
VLPTYEGGGAERIVSLIARELAAKGYAVSIAGLLERTCEATAPGTTTFALGARTVSAGVVPLFRLIQRERPTVVVSTLKHVSALVSLIQIASPIRFNHVIRVANTYSRELDSSGVLMKKLWLMLLRLSHARALRSICVSAGVQADLIANFAASAESCRLVPNPVDVCALEELAQQPSKFLEQFPSDEKLLLSVGRMTPQKDFATLIDAFAIMQANSEGKCSLVILGDGPERAKLESQIERLGLRDRVYLAGRVRNPYPFYKRADVFVLSSRFEGLPNVILEALAFRLPVVSTDCESGPREIIHDSRLGAMVPVGDAASLAAAMVRSASLTKDDFRRTYVLEKYALNRTVDMYEGAIGDD